MCCLRVAVGARKADRFNGLRVRLQPQRQPLQHQYRKEAQGGQHRPLDDDEAVALPGRVAGGDVHGKAQHTRQQQQADTQRATLEQSNQATQSQLALLTATRDAQLARYQDSAGMNTGNANSMYGRLQRRRQARSVNY